MSAALTLGAALRRGAGAAGSSSDAPVRAFGPDGQPLRSSARPARGERTASIAEAVTRWLDQQL
ncbi:hypothetical protein FGE12_17565 [Aggregicoccus sp. 17bor-14]|uniref:hypothetical protein n=1 Tax=Myxococcaceae TaxID=31 RepID=UPI00129C4B99|nr:MULTISPECIES: hypothetical protein [Myxococcaceae]MBF5044210.1 hypothetical protein [Simulacricoccus sp. 17bor-14]MRI89960.1 hypothetical protein [Aggregicoccus sp. 17bor-14]